jgi:hypothetical protein
MWGSGGGGVEKQHGTQNLKWQLFPNALLRVGLVQKKRPDPDKNRDRDRDRDRVTPYDADASALFLIAIVMRSRSDSFHSLSTS